MLTNCSSQEDAVALPSYKDTCPEPGGLPPFMSRVQSGRGARVDSDISSNYLYEDGRPLN